MVYARNNEDDRAIVYHWPKTLYTVESGKTMEAALQKIGWTSKSDDFSIVVYKQAGGSGVEEHLEHFVFQLKYYFAKDVKSVIYKDGHVLMMDGSGKVNL